MHDEEEWKTNGLHIAAFHPRLFPAFFPWPTATYVSNVWNVVEINARFLYGFCNISVGGQIERTIIKYTKLSTQNRLSKMDYLLWRYKLIGEKIGELNVISTMTTRLDVDLSIFFGSLRCQ